jgi:magnesium-transporting ATPase (P-type)
MTLYDDWYVSLYNILFTALPLTVKALFEKDIIDPEEHLGINSDNNFVSKQLSYTYYVGRESMIFNMERLSISIIFSLCYSVMVFFAVIYYLDGCIAPEYGYVSDFWVGATTQFTAIIFVKFN